MRLTGYCDNCRRIRNVRVNMARWVGRGTPTGICSDCEDAEHARRTGRRAL